MKGLLKIKDLPLAQQEPISKWLLEKYEVKNKLIKVKNVKRVDYDLWLALTYPRNSL